MRIFAGMIGSAVFNTEKLAHSCRGGFLEATDLAEYLVRKGLPFRTAHTVIAGIVRDCIASGKQSIDAMTLTELQEYSPLFEADLYQALKPESCIAARKLPGGPAGEEVHRQIAVLRKGLGA